MIKCEKNEGITLIALVITIIVLLILAGVSISMLTGQNGILNRAQEAKEKTEIAQKDENVKLREYENITNKFTNLPESAEGQKAGIAIKNPSSYGANSNAQATADGANKYFALPDGATYVTGTVDTGVVVNIKESEFVWVPVDDVVLDEQRDSELPKTSSEAKTKTYTPMTVQVQEDGINNYKGLLYSYSGSNCYLMYGSNSSVKYQGTSSQYREPDMVSKYDGTDTDTIEGKITTERLTTEYNAMIESVKKYKGFYVARYEAGLDNTTGEIVFKNANLTENNTTTTSAYNSETRSWYGLYKKIKTFATVENNEDKVVSSMIWGSQYDAMMNWMAKTGRAIETTDRTKTNTSRTTGSSSDDVINNVYDLYGCHYEWTLEAVSDGNRVGRGGDYDSNCSPAFRGDNYPYDPSSNGSSRATLYIK